MAADTPTAFVSYSRVDSEFALQLAEHLKAAGANVWLDQLDIEPGTPWDSAIEEALLKSTHMLVVLSTVSVTSDNVRDEVSYALSQQMKVIPVLYRECKVPFRLARLQHIDFRNDYDSAFKALLRTLRVEQQSVPSPAIPAPSLDDSATTTEAAERQRRDEEDRLEAQRAEHLAQQARWEEERQQQLAQRAKWEEEQRLRDQADAARQAEAAQQAEAGRRAELARQAEAARQAEMARQAEAARLAEAERNRAVAELAAQKRKQEQEAKRQAAQDTPPPPELFASINPGVTDSTQPQLQSSTSTPSSLGRIVLYAVVAGLARAICLIPMAFLGQLIGRSSSLISLILVGGVTGLVLYFVLPLFKPELSRKQVRPILWTWLGSGIALAVLNMDAFHSPLTPLRILLAILPVTIAGALTGLILARTLQNSGIKGIIIGIISFAIPAFLGQFFFVFFALRSFRFGGPFRLMYVAFNLCVATIEVGLLLTFIRNWGRTRSDI